MTFIVIIISSPLLKQWLEYILNSKFQNKLLILIVLYTVFSQNYLLWRLSIIGKNFKLFVLILCHKFTTATTKFDLKTWEHLDCGLITTHCGQDSSGLLRGMLQDNLLFVPTTNE